MKRRRYLYHCTVVDHGEVLRVRRKAPRYPSTGEPRTPRLCCSPTVPQCLSAFFPVDFTQVVVYRTTKPVRGVKAQGVWDACITDERWLLPGQELHRHAVLPEHKIADLYQPFAMYFRRTRKGSSARKRLAQLWLACVEFEEHCPRWLFKWVSSALEELQVDPFAEFDA